MNQAYSSLTAKRKTQIRLNSDKKKRLDYLTKQLRFTQFELVYDFTFDSFTNFYLNNFLLIDLVFDKYLHAKKLSKTIKKYNFKLTKIA